MYCEITVRGRVGEDREMEKTEVIALIPRCLSGDPEAQEALVLAVQDRVFYHCKKMLKKEEDAQDATQDVLITMITGLDKLREKIGDGKVLLALSGGVDSSVVAGLLSKAIGKQLTCVFVDHGLLRKNEAEEVAAVFGPEGPFDLNFICVDAKQRYYDKLAGVTEPEQKRKIIGEEFIHVFERKRRKSARWISWHRAPSIRT